MPRAAVWLLAFAGLVAVFAVLLPVAQRSQPLEPVPPAVTAARLGLRFATVGFGAALAAGPRHHRARGAAALAVLAASSVLAAVMGFFPSVTTRWLWPLTGSRLASAQVALIPVALTWLGAVLYELVTWRRRA